MQERYRRRAAPAVAVGELEIAGAFLARTVEVLVARDAGRLARVDECIAQGVLRQPHVGGAERAAGAVIGVLAALLVLRALEVGQHVLVRPADVAGCRHTLKSCAWPRTYSRPLMALEPPSTRPRGQLTMRLLRCGSGPDPNCQVMSGLVKLR
jgi:hypothetical protein